nr:unnamed protein product [Digitaria exilis]
MEMSDERSQGECEINERRKRRRAIGGGKTGEKYESEPGGLVQPAGRAQAQPDGFDVVDSL